MTVTTKGFDKKTNTSTVYLLQLLSPRRSVFISLKNNIYFLHFQTNRGGGFSKLTEDLGFRKWSVMVSISIVQFD